MLRFLGLNSLVSKTKSNNCQIIKANNIQLLERLTGVYVGSSRGRWNELHLLITERGLLTLAGTTVLDRKLSDDLIALEVSITATKQLQSKTGHNYKDFSIEVQSRSAEPNQTISKYIDWQTVVDHYSQFIKLNESDDHWTAFCPECDSGNRFTMFLYKSTNKFYCHNCKISGDIINWISLIDPRQAEYRTRRLFLQSVLRSADNKNTIQ